MTHKYVRGTPAEWAEGVKAFTVDWSPDTRPPKFLLTGPCPRCQHPIAVDLTDQKGVGLVGSSGLITVIVKCNCGVAHSGAPAGPSKGCGAEGTVLIKKE